MPTLSEGVSRIGVVITQASIGQRVRERIKAASPALSQRSVAQSVGMPPDALSRSLNDQRAFSSVELVRLADHLSADVHWLITGEPDPLAVRFAARHLYNREAGEHHVPGQENDQEFLDGIALAYRQAHLRKSGESPEIPGNPSQIRAALGEDFVTTFADRVEERFGVDVVRIKGLSTDYSFRIAGKPVILLKAEPNWFRSNWSLAHELGHLALSHHDAADPQSDGARERAANAFALGLLLPEPLLRSIDWASLSEAEIARHIWDLGVSTQALANSLQSFGVPVPPVIVARPEGATLPILRRNSEVIPSERRAGTQFFVVDPITRRMNQSAERRIPDGLIRAHLDGIAQGVLNKGTLAWLFEVTPDDVLAEEPPISEPVPTDELLTALGL